VLTWSGPLGCTLYFIDPDGGHRRPLPVGPPHTPVGTGHECFVGDTGQVLFSAFLEEGREGSLYLADPATSLVRPICRNAMCFGHVSASRYGRYFVADGFASPGAPIYIGSILTEKSGRLVGSGASCGSPEYTHPCPHVTADNRRLIYASDRTGIPQVYAAEVPPEFLASLE